VGENIADPRSLGQIKGFSRTPDNFLQNAEKKDLNLHAVIFICFFI
jgi:hypothetical protein